MATGAIVAKPLVQRSFGTPPAGSEFADDAEYGAFSYFLERCISRALPDGIGTGIAPA